MQPVEAVLDWNCPAEQSMQDAWAMLLLYCPARHARQLDLVVEPVSPLYRPEEQVLHEVDPVDPW